MLLLPLFQLRLESRQLLAVPDNHSWGLLDEVLPPPVPLVLLDEGVQLEVVEVLQIIQAGRDQGMPDAPPFSEFLQALLPLLKSFA